jgi:hypothetical protein
MAKKAAGISFRPEDGEATGLLNDVDLTVTAAECVTWDYNGTQDDSPALKLTLEDEDGKEYEQYWSAGSAERLEPSEDGSTFVPVDGKKAKGMGKTTNVYRLFESLEAAGFPADKLEPKALVGLKAHFVRMKTGKRDDGTDSETLLVEEIKKLPWEKEGKKTSAKAGKSKPGSAVKDSKKSKASKEEEEEEEVDETEDEDEDEEEETDADEFDAKQTALDSIAEVLADNEDGLPKPKMVNEVFKKVNKLPKEQRKAVLELLDDDDFWGDDEQEVFKLKGSKVIAQ